MDNMAFQAALAGYNKAFDEAEAYDNWAPLDNDYTVMISAIKRGVSQKEGAAFVWWKIMAKLVTPDLPDYDGKDFSLAFFSNKTFGKMKTVCNQISQNTTRRKINDYDQEMDGYVGKPMNVRVYRTKSEKNGKTYVNVDITDILTGVDVVPVTDDSAVEPSAEVEPEVATD